MKHRIAQVVIVDCDEKCQSRRQARQDHLHRRSPSIGEDGKEEDTCGIDHAELVQELHRILERRVESE